MKIVNRRAFLALPAGTVFAKYHPCTFWEFSIKTGNSPTNDFYCSAIVSAIESSGCEAFGRKLDAAEHGGVSLPMDFESSGRDGEFNLDQLFAVWEPADVEGLISRLQWALAEAAKVTAP